MKETATPTEEWPHPERQAVRAAIAVAINRWHSEGYAAWVEAGKPEPVEALLFDGFPDIAEVGVRAIDAALPHLMPCGSHPRRAFLDIMDSLLWEKPDAGSIGESRKKSTQEAARLIREAADLLDEAGGDLLATLLHSIACHAEAVQCGMVFPTHIYGGDKGTIPSAPERSGPMLDVHVEMDALSSMFAGRGGKKARDANIVKAIAQHFPDSQEFLSASSGYAIIANLAALCGLTGKTAQAKPNEYVCALLKKGRT